MILRKEFAELQKPKAAIPRSFDFLQPLQNRNLVSWRGTDHQWTFSNGSILQFGHLSDSKAIHKYLGAQVDLMDIDQAEELVYEEFRRLRGSNRSTGAHHIHNSMFACPPDCPISTTEPFRPRMRLTANPGGVGQNWIKSLFIDAAPPEVMFWVDTRGDDPVVYKDHHPHCQSYLYVPAKVWDNPALLAMDPDYVDRLYSVGGLLARAWVNGDWTGFEGQYFTEWRPTRHVCKPFRIPASWPKWHATDYGISKPSCTLWLARATTGGKTPDNKIIRPGSLVVYRERYEVKQTVAQQALKIRTWSGGEVYRNQLLDPACWGMESNGMTIAEQYAMGGVSMSKANNDRRSGCARMHELLRWCQDPEMKPCELCIQDAQILNEGCTHNVFEPGVIIMNHCVNTIRTLPNLIVDPHDPEVYESKVSEDHAADTLRYAIMGSDTQMDYDESFHQTAYFGAR